MPKKKMHLGHAMYNDGTHPAGWMEIPRDVATDIEHFKRVARRAEAAKFDMLFRADIPMARMSNVNAWSRNPFSMNILEPVTLFAALSQVTTHIGLASTISTTFNEAYNVARTLAALDHVSGGRAAWNAVTTYSPQAAKNFGMEDIPTHRERYARAREFVEVIQRLWDTYEDDAILNDVTSGYYFDPKKFHPVNFKGQYISVEGALNVARPPQGYPVLIQAGASADGMQFAAEKAEVIFALNAPLNKSKAFYAEVKSRALSVGRDRDSLKILPALVMIIGDTKEQAQQRFDDLEARVPDEVKLQYLSDDLGVNLNELPLDQPVPLELVPQSTKLISAFFEKIAEMIRARMPLKEMLRHYRRGSGDILIGTVAQICDSMEHWIDEEACDGFNLVCSAAAHFDEICDKVIPELQRRGRFRAEYGGKTLRDHFELPRPQWTSH